MLIVDFLSKWVQKLPKDIIEKCLLAFIPEIGMEFAFNFTYPLKNDEYFKYAKSSTSLARVICSLFNKNNYPSNDKGEIENIIFQLVTETNKIGTLFVDIDSNDPYYSEMGRLLIHLKLHTQLIAMLIIWNKRSCKITTEFMIRILSNMYHCNNEDIPLYNQALSYSINDEIYEVIVGDDVLDNMYPTERMRFFSRLNEENKRILMLSCGTRVLAVLLENEDFVCLGYLGYEWVDGVLRR